jgi:hypothetical protein
MCAVVFVGPTFSSVIPVLCDLCGNYFFDRRQDFNTENTASTEYTEDLMGILEVTFNGKPCYRPHLRVLKD